MGILEIVIVVVAIVFVLTVAGVSVYKMVTGKGGCNDCGSCRGNCSACPSRKKNDSK